MKRIAARKNTSIKKHKRSQRLNIRYVSIFFVVLLIILVGNIFIKGTTKTHVLGTSIGPVLLADTDQTDHPDQPTPTLGETKQISDNSTAQNNILPQPENQNNPPSLNSGDNHPSDNTQVDCVGPDGKHFTTDFHNCQELNSNWGHTTFNFTQLNSKQNDNNSTELPEPTQTAIHENISTPKGNLEVQTEGNKGKFNLESAGTHIEIKKEDNGSIKIVAHKADGTEVQLETNALDQINNSLLGEGVSVSTASANGFAIQSGGVQAETNFPLFIDPTTKSLSVTTPNGTKDVTTLPDQAVQSALQQGQLTNVLSTGNQTTPNATSGNNTVALTELNNQPAYAVQGVSDKKLFGIFPVAFQKTVYVSAQNGQTLQTQEAFFNKILEAFSF